MSIAKNLNKKILPSEYPYIKSAVYWNAPKVNSNCVLQNSGLTTFKEISYTTYFSYK